MLLLDIDNTILPSIQAYDYAVLKLEKFLKNFYSISPIKFRELYEKSRWETKQDLNGQASSRLRLLYFKKLIESIQGQLTSKDLKNLLKIEKKYFMYYKKYLHKFFQKNKNNYKYAFNILEELSKKYSLCFLSNENLRTQLLKLTEILPSSLPFHLIVSEELGIEKPNPKIYQKALHKNASWNGMDSQSIMIGDNWEDDIIGARELGFIAIHQIEIWGDKNYLKELEPRIYQTSNLITSLELAEKLFQSSFSTKIL